MERFGAPQNRTNRRNNTMPNHANNKIKVVGDRETLDKFRKAVGSYGEEREVQDRDIRTNEIVRNMEKIVNVFDFEKIIPYPEKFEMFEEVEVPDTFEEGKMEKFEAWYIWRNEKWGVKWNSGDATVTDDGIDLTFNFWTAWCYPQKIFDKIIKDWKTLTFNFTLTEEFSQYDIEAKASKGEWNYFYDYFIENTGGYEDDGPQFYVLYRKNELSGAVEALAQNWFSSQLEYDQEQMWCEYVKRRNRVLDIQRKALVEQSTARARNILSWSKPPRLVEARN
jgi:hypothetical protein